MKYEFFEKSKKELFDKNNYVKNYINYMLTKTNELFIYENIPENIDIKRMEYFLQKNGYVFFTKDNDFNFYNGSLFDFDVYEKPKQINAVLQDRSVKTYNIEKDGILICNDFLMTGLEKIYKKYGVMLCECEITLYMNSIINRIQYLINANDDNTKKNADLFIDKIYNGEFSVIGSNAFFDGVEIKGTTTQNNNTQNNIELTQYIKASAFNEIGLNSNFNMKRERLNEKELTLNENAIKPFIENMFNCRLSAVEKINKKYGLNIVVKMSTIWDNYTQQTETPDNTEKNNNVETVDNKEKNIDDKTVDNKEKNIDDKTVDNEEKNIDDKTVDNKEKVKKGGRI